MKLLEWLEGEEEGAAPRRPGRELSAALRRTVQQRRERRPEVALTRTPAELVRWNLLRGAQVSVGPRLEAILRGNGLAVVAGQQPALFGGPLYTLYKLVSAVALAARLEQTTGLPTLAVFWLVGDDSDFGEVSSAWLARRDGSLWKLRDGGEVASGQMIGRLPALRQRAVFEPERPLLAQYPRGPEILRLLETAAVAGEDWCGLQARLFFGLLPDLPFAVIDGGDPTLLREAGAWLRSAGSAPLASLLREGEGEARAAGFEPALDPGLGDRALFRLEGDRRTPLSEAAGPDVLLAPNVVLRPLLQDACLPNVATICGPSEIRYRSQLGPLYRRLEIPEPVCLPRLRATLVPPLGELAAAPDGPARFSEAIRDPDRFLARSLERALPRDLQAELAAVRDRLRDDLVQFSSRVSRFDSSLGQMVDSASGKADYQLARIEEGLVAKARHRLFRQEPHLTHWKELVRPRDGGQERTLSLLWPFLQAADPVADLAEAAAAQQQRMLEEDGRSAEALLLLPESPGGS